jgi:hypothetical protein
MQTQDDPAVVEPRVTYEIGAMNAFEEDREVVFQQFPEQLFARAGADDIGQFVREAFVPFVAFVIVDLYAIVIENGLAAATVFEAVQVDLYSGAVQTADLVKQVEDASVVYRIWDVQTHDM